MHWLPRNIDAIVEEQVRRWEIERKLREKKAPAPEHWPVVTLSREYGARGSELGEGLATRLGFRIFDKELVHAVAAASRAKEALLATLDERDQSALADFVAQLVSSAEASALEYAAEVGRIIHSLDRHGSAVIVGRGGQFLVPAERALRVRVVAPLDKRIATCAERDELTPREAERKVRDTDREREQFHKRHFRKDLADCSYYDLVVNTGSLAFEACLELVVSAYRLKFGKLPAAGA